MIVFIHLMIVGMDVMMDNHSQMESIIGTVIFAIGVIGATICHISLKDRIEKLEKKMETR